MIFTRKRNKKQEDLAAQTALSPQPGSGATSGISVGTEHQQQIKDQMAANSQAWHSAATQAERDQLHAKNEALAQLLGGSVRYDSSSGKWSGSAGTQQKSGTQSSFSYRAAPSYVSRYQDKLDALTQKLLDREPFDYDPDTDPLYQQYQKSYARNGQRAMQDTLGQVSARTGGLASSYATSAAQQTYNNYMAGLADKLPELQQLAYRMYQDRTSAQRDDLELLASLEQEDYARYSDALDQYGQDRAFAYSQYRDAVADQRYDSQQRYQRERDQLGDARYEREQAADQSEAEYQKALEKAETLADRGDFSGYAALGYLPEEIRTMQAAYDAAQLLAAQGGRTGTKSSSSSGKSGSDKNGSSTSGSDKSGATDSGDGAERLAKNALAWAGQQRARGRYDADPKQYIELHYKESVYNGVTKAKALAQLKTYQVEQRGHTEYAWQRATPSQTKQKQK